MSNFEIVIVSLPNKENLVAEIYYKNLYWVQISQETIELTIRFYSHPTQDYWEFSYDEAIMILEKAKKKLLNIK